MNDQECIEHVKSLMTEKFFSVERCSKQGDMWWQLRRFDTKEDALAFINSKKNSPWTHRLVHITKFFL